MSCEQTDWLTEAYSILSSHISKSGKVVQTSDEIIADCVNVFDHNTQREIEKSGLKFHSIYHGAGGMLLRLKTPKV